MANAAEIADLLTAGIRAPEGPEDIAAHTGTVQSWNSVDGTNVVTINGVDVPNLRSLQAGGIPASYLPGDTVMVMRKQTQYFVMGKVSAGGRSEEHTSELQSRRDLVCR